jgi:putative ABC transport system permease protein
MRRVALRGLLGRKLRSILTGLAIVIGVAMISGTFVLTDTIDRAFHSVFTAAYAQTDAVVSGKKLVDWSTSGNATVSPALLARVHSLPEVGQAAGLVLDFSNPSDTAQLLDHDGKVIQSSGSPTFGFGIDPEAEQFNPFRLTEGRWAAARDEVAIDADTASANGYALGDPISVSADGPTRRFTVVGILKLGDLSSLGGATISVFTAETARRILHKPGYDSIAVSARDGISSGRLVAALERIVPGDAQVRTGAEEARASEDETTGFMSFVRAFLLAFAAVALVVGAFVIFNTFSITVAQRMREFATLRTLGASRRQVLRSVLLESLALGLGASLVGLAAGVGLAKGLSSALSALGLALPQASLVFATRTVVVSLAVGILVTLVAALVPAVKATRIPPIAAVREGATPRASHRLRPLVGLALGGLGLVVVVYSILATGASVLLVVSGCLLLFAGVAAAAARLVPGIVAAVGWPSRTLGGSAGRLATRNATRSPARTASAAAALMIGLALVTLFAVVAQGLRGSDRHAIERQLSADWIVKADGDPGTLPIAAGRALGASGLTVSAVRYDRARLGDSNMGISGLDSHVARFVHFDWTNGSDTTMATLGSGDAVLPKSTANGHHIAVGDRFRLRTPAGKPIALRLVGISDPDKLDPLLDGVLISQATFDRFFPRPRDIYLFAAGDVGRSAVESTLSGYPAAQIFTYEGFIEDRSAFVGQFLNLVYVLLALSIVVSLFGMVNTLVLSVFERTRELGMLRAVGMTRRQARQMVRHESVITALIGAALGLPLGLLLAAAVIRQLSDYGVTYQVPAAPLAVFVAVAVVAGLAAALLPARRASRLNVLEALQYE